MFNTNNDYSEAVQKAQLYAQPEEKRDNKKMLLINMVLVVVLMFALLKYLDNNRNILERTNGLPISKQAVLGVSETIEEGEMQTNVYQMMEVVTPTSSIKSQASYPKAITKELDDRSGFRGKIAVVSNSEEKL